MQKLETMKKEMDALKERERQWDEDIGSNEVKKLVEEKERRIQDLEGQIVVLKKESLLEVKEREKKVKEVEGEIKERDRKIKELEGKIQKLTNNELKHEKSINDLKVKLANNKSTTSRKRKRSAESYVSKNDILLLFVNHFTNQKEGNDRASLLASVIEKHVDNATLVLCLLDSLAKVATMKFNDLIDTNYVIEILDECMEHSPLSIIEVRDVSDKIIKLVSTNRSYSQWVGRYETPIKSESKRSLTFIFSIWCYIFADICKKLNFLSSLRVFILDLVKEMQVADLFLLSNIAKVWPQAFISK